MKLRRICIVALVLLFFVPGLVTAQEANLLQNGGFEGEYVAVPGGFAAPSWTTHALENTRPPLADVGGGSNPTRRPEYKPILAEHYPERVAEGEKAQVAFAFYGIMDAAFSQQVAVEKGKDVQGSIQGHGWSTNSDDPNKHSGEVYVSLGIGAEGQTWPWEHGIVWKQYEWTPAEYTTYYSRVVTAEADRVTFFILVTNKWAVKHNDFYLDDAKVWVVEGEDCTDCPDCPPCPPGEGCDYATIGDVLRQVLESMTWVARSAGAILANPSGSFSLRDG